RVVPVGPLVDEGMKVSFAFATAAAVLHDNGVTAVNSLGRFKRQGDNQRHVLPVRGSLKQRRTRLILRRKVDVRRKLDAIARGYARFERVHRKPFRPAMTSPERLVGQQ